MNKKATIYDDGYRLPEGPAVSSRTPRRPSKASEAKAVIRRGPPTEMTPAIRQRVRELAMTAFELEVRGQAMAAATQTQRQFISRLALELDKLERGLPRLQSLARQAELQDTSLGTDAGSIYCRDRDETEARARQLRDDLEHAKEEQRRLAARAQELAAVRTPIVQTVEAVCRRFNVDRAQLGISFGLEAPPSNTQIAGSY